METINHEYYGSPEVAELLKEAGFDWECREYYYNFTTTGWSLSFDDNFVNWNSWGEQYISAPTLDVAQRWLREVANLSVHVFMSPYQSEDDYKWAYSIIYEVCIERYKTYEEAQEAGIKKALEIILEKGE